MRAEIIAIGSELLSPWRLDTNSLFITEHLNRVGIRVWRKTIVGDRLEDLKHVFSAALQQADIVFCIGGLGPTQDDLTREAVAEVLGRKLCLNDEALQQLEQRYARIGVTMTPNNRQQAMVPEGGIVVPNPNGTAPGLFLAHEDRLVFLLPGPPHELKAMIVNQVMGFISRYHPTSPLIYRQLKIASEGESRVDHLVAPVYKSYPEVETTILASAGIVDLFFYWLRPEETERSDAVLDELTTRVKDLLGPSVFAEREESLEAVTGSLLRQRGKTLATAESCTGGFLSKLITDVPGSSDYFRGGMITYSNESKSSWLGVDRAKIEEFGAVSPVVAQTMAERVRLLAEADFGLSVTGIAGPSGGTADKPVGLVYVGFADAKGSELKKLQLPGDREIVRLRTARMALDWVRRRLL
ncbi:MAG: competence/damage-inducible protein A [Acidobacteria bacterium]|nr:MAG: competence/damage-inducible protein A [Acidobacteriota bacterium]